MPWGTGSTRTTAVLEIGYLEGILEIPEPRCAVGYPPNPNAGALTVQGNCADPPPSAVALQLSGDGLAPRLGSQCILTTPADTLHVSAGSVWLDRLYLRLRATGVADPLINLVSANKAGRLWMTNVTMQGDGDRDCQGVSCGAANGALIQGAACMRVRSVRSVPFPSISEHSRGRARALAR